MSELPKNASQFELVDGVFVGLAGAIFVGAAMLQRSLGDVVGDEAKLPPAAGAKTVRCLLLSEVFQIVPQI